MEEHDLGRLRNVNPDTSKAFSFTDESQDLAVKVDIQLQVLEVPDEQGGLETGLGPVNFFLPLLPPHILIREKGVSKSVMVLNMLADVRRALSNEVLRELLHRHGYPVEKVARPGDSTGHGRQVTHNWWTLLVTLVVVLDLLDFSAILGKEKIIFSLKSILKRVTVQDAFKLPQKSQTVNNIRDISEVLVNIFLQLSLNVGNIDVELYEISVETVIFILKETMGFSLELADITFEYLQNGLDVLKIMFLESLKLLFSAEKVNKFTDASLEQIKAAENLGW